MFEDNEERKRRAMELKKQREKAEEAIRLAEANQRMYDAQAAQSAQPVSPQPAQTISPQPAQVVNPTVQPAVEPVSATETVHEEPVQMNEVQKAPTKEVPVNEVNEALEERVHPLLRDSIERDETPQNLASTTEKVSKNAKEKPKGGASNLTLIICTFALLLGMAASTAFPYLYSKSSSDSASEAASGSSAFMSYESLRDTSGAMYVVGESCKSINRVGNTYEVVLNDGSVYEIAFPASVKKK